MGIGVLIRQVDYLPAWSFVVVDDKPGFPFVNVQGDCMAWNSWLAVEREAVAAVPMASDLIGCEWSPSFFLAGGRWSMVSRDVALVAKGYLDAMLWAETDFRYAEGEEVDGDECHDRPFDRWADAWTCSDRLLCHCLETARTFVEANGDDFLTYIAADGIGGRDGGPAEWFGHDLWLTRCGHGCGFWDRGLGDLGERLSDAARALGEVYPYSAPVDGAVDEIEEREVTI